MRSGSYTWKTWSRWSVIVWNTPTAEIVDRHAGETARRSADRDDADGLRHAVTRPPKCGGPSRRPPAPTVAGLYSLSS